MNPISQRASAFKKSVLELRLLSDREIDEVIEQSAHAGLSPIELLVRKGLVTSTDIDVIDLLVRADEAIPGYELLNLIGRGGMGVVYRARQKALNRIVALKTVLANKATDKLALARFEREALMIAQLSHPHIVNPLDFGQHDGRFYLAMEMVEGEDLGAYIDRRGPLPEWAAWGIARQIAAGLLHASRAGVIHRDIKPANVLLVKAPEGYALRPGLPMAKISDFGLAILNSQQVVSERLTSEDSKVGSPNYMAPEQFDGPDCDTRADIYALGATVFHLLVGRPPWSGKSLQQIFSAQARREPISIRDFRPDLSAESIALIANMMEPVVERRTADYERLMSAMASLSEDANSTISVRPTSLDTATTSETPTLEMSGKKLASPNGVGNRRKWLIATASGLVVAMATGYWLIAHRRASELAETNEQRRLFDGQNVFSPEVTQLAGGWAARDGRLVHETGSLGALTFHLPEWNYFAFEAIVENIASHAITLQFSAKLPGGKGERSGLQVVGDGARLGTLHDWRSEFVPSSKDLRLDADRQAHAIRIERRQTSWMATVDDVEVGSVRADSRELPEITLAVHKLRDEGTKSMNLELLAEKVAVSEVVTTRLLPRN